MCVRMYVCMYVLASKQTHTKNIYLFLKGKKHWVMWIKQIIMTMGSDVVVIIVI